ASCWWLGAFDPPPKGERLFSTNPTRPTCGGPVPGARRFRRFGGSALATEPPGPRGSLPGLARRAGLDAVRRQERAVDPHGAQRGDGGGTHRVVEREARRGGTELHTGHERA